MIRALLGSLLLLVVRPLDGIADNPVLKSSQSIASRGLSSAAAPAVSPGKFKPEAKSTTLGPLVKELVEDEGDRKAMQEVVEQMMAEFNKQLTSGGYGNDAAAAMGFTTGILAAVITGKEIDEAGIAQLVKQFQATLDTPQVRGASDKQKQEAYEMSLLAATLTLVGAQAGEKEAKGVATQMLKALLGADASQVKVAGGKVSITPKPGAVSPKPEPSAPSVGGGLAPGFTYSKPAGWTERDGWLANDRVASRYEGHRETTTALVRFYPAQSAQGNMGTMLEKLWDTLLPAEAKGRRSAMIYRRFVGDGLLAQFVSGTVREKGRDSDTLYWLMLIDCKTHWQPVLIAQIYDENTTFRTGIDRIAVNSFSESAVTADQVLQTFRCPTAKGTPLVTREALAGTYSYGTGSTLWTENVYTGATSMSFVSYGGNFNLKADGTFTWTMTGASGRNTISRVTQIKATGKWTIEGDVLHVVYATYDQGDSYKAKEKRYKIAGLAVFPGGKKVAVLLDRWQSPVNPTTVGDSGDWYSTGK